MATELLPPSSVAREVFPIVSKAGFSLHYDGAQHCAESVGYGSGVRDGTASAAGPASFFSVCDDVGQVLLAVGPLSATYQLNPGPWNGPARWVTMVQPFGAPALSINP